MRPQTLAEEALGIVELMMWNDAKQEVSYALADANDRLGTPCRSGEGRSL